jgi:hypothetical protein
MVARKFKDVIIPSFFDYFMTPLLSITCISALLLRAAVNSSVKGKLDADTDNLMKHVAEVQCCSA